MRNYFGMTVSPDVKSLNGLFYYFFYGDFSAFEQQSRFRALCNFFSGNKITSPLPPSSKVAVLLCPQLFFSDSKVSPSTRSVIKWNSPVHTHPVFGFTLVPRSPLQ